MAGTERMERTDKSDLGVAVDQADAEAGARANKVRGEKNFILAVGVVVAEEKLDRVTFCRLQKDAVKRWILWCIGRRRCGGGDERDDDERFGFATWKYVHTKR